MSINTVIFVFNQVWPMLIILSVVLISIRVTDLILNKKKFNFISDLINFLFLIYILTLFYIVTFQDVDWSTYNTVLFQEILRYQIGSELFFKNVLGNIIMFVPYGIYLSYHFKLKKPYLIMLLTLILSVTIETTQYYIGRVFDVDDILLNFIGGLVGHYCYRTFCRIFKRGKR